MSRFGEQCNRVGKVTAYCLDEREAPENQQGNEQPAFACVVSVAVTAVSMTVGTAVPMGAMIVLMSVVRVIVGAVMILSPAMIVSRVVVLVAARVGMLHTVR